MIWPMEALTVAATVLHRSALTAGEEGGLAADGTLARLHGDQLDSLGYEILFLARMLG